MLSIFPEKVDAALQAAADAIAAANPPEVIEEVTSCCCSCQWGTFSMVECFWLIINLVQQNHFMSSFST